MALLEVSNLSKSFRQPEGDPVEILSVPRFEVDSGKQLAIRGESGSGKTTFLNLLAGILTADSGSVRLNQKELTSLSESERDRFRAQQIGYIFQTFNLLPAFTALENVLLGMSFGAKVDHPRAMGLLKRVGLDGKENHFPAQLSTGQQQRVAVARALANQPVLVLADEPTGNLDAANAARALTLIREACQENHAALILVSHDRGLLGEMAEVVEWSDLNQTRVKP